MFSVLYVKPQTEFDHEKYYNILDQTLLREAGNLVFLNSATQKLHHVSSCSHHLSFMLDSGSYFPCSGLFGLLKSILAGSDPFFKASYFVMDMYGRCFWQLST